MVRAADRDRRSASALMQSRAWASGANRCMLRGAAAHDRRQAGRVTCRRADVAVRTSTSVAATRAGMSAIASRWTTSAMASQSAVSSNASHFTCEGPAMLSMGMGGVK